MGVIWKTGDYLEEWPQTKSCFLCAQNIDALPFVYWTGMTEAEAVFLHPHCAMHLQTRLAYDIVRLEHGVDQRWQKAGPHFEARLLTREQVRALERGE